MNTRAILATLSTMLLATVAQAAITPSTDLTLVIAADGTATIRNNTASDVRFGFYIIRTSSPILLPATTVTSGPTSVAFDTVWRGTTQWAPIQKQVKMGGTYSSALDVMDPNRTKTSMKVVGASSNTTTQLAEVDLADNFVIPRNGSFSIGKIVNNFGSSLADLFTTPTDGIHTFQWGWVADGTDNGGEFTGQVPSPEPATLSLLALGGLAVLRRKRK